MINAAWHKQNPMPMGSTLNQRVDWHVAHAKACGCRAMPPTVLAELRRRGKTPARRLSVFAVKSHAPTDADLRETLGRAYAPWKKLIALVGKRISPITERWEFTSANTGWGMRLRYRDRVILYMTPQQGQFLVSVVLGQKAVAAVQTVRLSEAVRDAVAAAPRYAEGTGVRITVTSSRQLPALATLAMIKWEN